MNADLLGDQGQTKFHTMHCQTSTIWLSIDKTLLTKEEKVGELKHPRAAIYFTERTEQLENTRLTCWLHIVGNLLEDLLLQIKNGQGY
jgi:hypothetical protein